MKVSRYHRSRICVFSTIVQQQCTPDVMRERPGLFEQGVNDAGAGYVYWRSLIIKSPTGCSSDPFSCVSTSCNPEIPPRPSAQAGVPGPPRHRPGWSPSTGLRPTAASQGTCADVFALGNRVLSPRAPLSLQLDGLRLGALRQTSSAINRGQSKPQRVWTCGQISRCRESRHSNVSLCTHIALLLLEPVYAPDGESADPDRR